MREKQREGIGVVVYLWIALIMRIEWGLARCYYASWQGVCVSVFVCVHTIIMCIYNPKWPGHVGRDLPPPRAQSVGCKVTGETQVHGHRHCRCQVCWGGNCQCGRPAAGGSERETWRGKWEASGGDCLPEGPAQYLRVVVYPIPLCPLAPLRIPLIVCLFCPLSFFCPTLAPVHAHFQFPTFFTVFSLTTRCISISLPGSHWAFTERLHYNLIPQHVYSRRDPQSHVCLSFLSPDSIQREPTMYVH